MADILSLPNCGGTTSTLNTGVPLCDVIRKEPKGLILLDEGLEANAAARATIATFVAWLRTATRAARGARAFPIFDLTNYEDTSEAPTKASIGNLSTTQITMQQGVPSFSFQHRKGDLFHKQLADAENASVTLLIVDSAYVVYGTSTSGGNFTGYSLSEFYAELAKFATATEPSKYPFNVALSSITEYKENFAFVQLDSTIFSISGNRDVDLNNPAAPVVQVTNVAKITPIARGGKNLGVLYPTQLAATAAWVATNDQTGAAHAITSVAWDATNLRFNVTLDSTAYTALATNDTVSIDLVGPAALTALGVDGYESIGPAVVTK